MAHFERAASVQDASCGMISCLLEKKSHADIPNGSCTRRKLSAQPRGIPNGSCTLDMRPLGNHRAAA